MRSTMRAPGRFAHDGRACGLEGAGVMGGRAWPAEHVAVVRERYGVASAQVIAAQLGRTPSAVRNCAAQLGLVTGARRLWTTLDEQRLRRLYPRLGMIRTAIEMGRTEYAVARRAMELGIPGRRGQRRPSTGRRAYRPWSRLDDVRMRDEYVALGAAELAERLGRTPNAVHLRARLLGLARERT